MTTLHTLLGPELPGAACIGLAPTFDLDIAGEDAQTQHQRHAMASQVCATCVALTACRRAVVEANPPVQGVWAGEVRQRPGNRKRAVA